MVLTSPKADVADYQQRDTTYGANLLRQLTRQQGRVKFRSGAALTPAALRTPGPDDSLLFIRPFFFASRTVLGSALRLLAVANVSHSAQVPTKSDYRNVWSAAELQAKNEEWQLVCVNVFGL